MSGNTKTFLAGESLATSRLALFGVKRVQNRDKQKI